MSNKDIKFTIRLNVDGKEQIGTLISSAKDIKKAFNAASTSTEEFGKALTNINQAFGALNALQSAIDGLTAESSSFAQSMAIANTMAGKGGKDFEALKDSVSDLAKEIPLTRDALANGLYQVISNGVPENNWIDYLRASAKASVGGVADLGETVKVTSTIIKNYGLSWDDATAIQDKIQLTAKNGVTSFEQLAAALPRVTGNAATLGVSIDELMATFATLTGVSGNTAEVSTQLAAVFTALVKPSSEATKIAKAMGVEFDAAAIKAAGGFQQFLTKLDATVQSYAQANGMLAQEIYGKLFGSAESLRAVGALTGQLKDKFQENATAMADSTGTIDEAFGIMGNTGSATMQLLKNKAAALTDTVASLARSTAPLLNFTAQIGMSINAITALQKAIPALAETFGISATKINIFRTSILSAGTAVIALVAALGKLTFDVYTEELQKNSIAARRQREETERLKATEEGRTRAQKDITQATAQATQAADAQAAKIEKLRKIVKDGNASMNERLRAIQDLRSIIPDYNARIDEQGRAYESNTQKVDDYIHKLKELYVVEAAEKKLKALYAKEIEQKGQVDTNRREYMTARQGYIKEQKEADSGSGKGFWTTLAKNFINARGVSGAASGASLSYAAGYRATTPAEDRVNTANQKLFHSQNALASTQSEISALETTIKEMKENEGKASGNNGGNGNGGNSTSGHTSGHTPTPPQDATPEIGSLDWYDQAISECDKFIKSTSDAEAAQERLRMQLALQAKRKDLAIRLGIEAPDKAEVRDKMDVLQELLHNAEKDYEQADTTETKEFALNRINIWKSQIEALQAQRITLQLEVDPQGAKQTIQDLRRTKYSQAQSKASTVQSDLADGLIDGAEANRQIKQINDDLAAQIGKGFKPITLQVDTQEAEHGIKHFVTQSRKAWSGITSGVDAVQSLTETLQGNGTVWEKLTAVVGTFFTVMDSVSAVLEVVNALTKVSTATKQADTSATQTNTTTSVANTTAKAGEALAGAASSGASLPFPANIAAIAAAVAAVVAVIATISSLAFEGGGIVPGTSYTGDRITARVNSGEMILNPRQQANLWRLANTPITIPTPNAQTINPTTPTLNLAALRANLQAPQVNVSMSGRIRGRDIVTVLANETRTNRRPTNIHI